MRRAKLLAYTVLSLALLVGLLQIFIEKSGKFFVLEFAGTFLMLLLILVGFIGYSLRWGERLFFLVSVFYLGNLVLVWYFKGAFYVILALLALVLFGLSFPRQKLLSSDQPASAKPAAKFTPGKYVASARSNVYHEPKCDWAKKIDPTRQVWFQSKEEAEEKKYMPHSCLTTSSTKSE
ncbi:hypothetical protein HYX14_04900 [Candidatus Woesearchaeota archaeon]|nr:hypothetical protein [Candidatus Woesearchaeota archaeon]